MFCFFYLNSCWNVDILSQRQDKQRTNKFKLQFIVLGSMLSISYMMSCLILQQLHEAGIIISFQKR